VIIAARWLAVAAVLAACGGGDKPAATPRDAVLDAWRADKLAPGPLVPAKVAFGADCQTTSVSGVEVLLCNYATPAEAKAAEDAGLGWVGQVTGASQAHGSALVVLADRTKADPSGKTINRLLKLAPN
jgi:hypothetical protein